MVKLLTGQEVGVFVPRTTVDNLIVELVASNIDSIETGSNICIISFMNECFFES